MNANAKTAALYQLDPDSDLPPRLLQLFLRSAPGQQQVLFDACKARDVEAARAQAHKLKGSLYAAGASRLATKLETLRATLATGDFPEVEALLPAIKDELASVLAELTRQLAQGSG